MLVRYEQVIFRNCLRATSQLSNKCDSISNMKYFWRHDAIPATRFLWLRQRALPLALVTVAVGVVGMFGYVTLSQTEVTAAPLSQSVLCAPNICNTVEQMDSFQDITLVNELAGQPSGERWRIEENLDDDGDADRMLLEVAHQDNHHMRQVVVGVYVTPDIYNGLDGPSGTLPIRFETRNCRTADNPHWRISVRNPSTSARDLLREYDYAGSATQQANADYFCANRPGEDVIFELASHKNRFVSYAGGLLWYTEIVVDLQNYTGTPPSSRNVRFQMKLDDVCGMAITCRQYLAIVKDDDGDNRNFAVSGRTPALKTTTNPSDVSAEPSRYELFNRTYRQRAMRQYMEFGLPCDATVPDSGAIIRLYDINDGDNTPPDEHGWIGGRDIVGVVLQYYDDSTTPGGWRAVPRSDINISAADSRASFAGPHNTDTISERNHYLYGVEGIAAPGDVIIPTDDDFIETRIRFTMSPQTRYRITITPNAGRNFIAVGLPGDQIAGLIDCDSIIDTPKSAAVQVWGNDLRVGGRYAGDTTNTDGAAIRANLLQGPSSQSYGSWGEYGVLAPGAVEGVASGSGLTGNVLSINQSQWSPLTFANDSISDARCSGVKGCYSTGSTMGSLPDLATAIDNNQFNGVTIQSSCLSIAARTVTSSSIIRCSGTLEITGNIDIGSGFTEQSLPQLIIIADRINIRSTVTRINAWLIASGEHAVINTCSDVAGSLTLSLCDEPLQVNGPTIAKTLLLRRTAGADGGSPSSPPAERFNLRGDAYIWAYRQAKRTSSIRTDYIRELPPRY